MKSEDYNRFAVPTPHHLRVSLIGSPTIHVGDRAVACPSRKGMAALVYLIAQPNGQAERDTLAGLLWGDQPGDQARTNLRQALWRLKQTLENAGFDGLTAGRVTISIARNAAGFDIDELTAALTNHPDEKVLGQVARNGKLPFPRGF